MIFTNIQFDNPFLIILRDSVHLEGTDKQFEGGP